MTKFIWKPITRQMQMGRRRNKSDIKFIVVHWTSNTSSGAGAMAHYNYLQYNSVRPGSAHYYVDDNLIVQCIGDTTVAWAVEGRGYINGRNGCWNSNSISIEMCVNNGYSDKMLFNTIELVKALLKRYPHAIVCRHWDCNRKDCPGGWGGSNNSKWNGFLEEIKKNRKMIIDLDKTSECIIVDKNNLPTKPQNSNNNAAIKNGRSKVPGEGKYSVLVNCRGDVLKVRENPDASTREVSSYRHGSKIYVNSVWKGNGETWYEIPYKRGKVGYVSARYCEGIK